MAILEIGVLKHKMSRVINGWFIGEERALLVQWGLSVHGLTEMCRHFNLRLTIHIPAYCTESPLYHCVPFTLHVPVVICIRKSW